MGVSAVLPWVSFKVPAIKKGSGFRQTNILDQLPTLHPFSAALLLGGAAFVCQLLSPAWVGKGKVPCVAAQGGHGPCPTKMVRVKVLGRGEAVWGVWFFFFFLN